MTSSYGSLGTLSALFCLAMTLSFVCSALCIQLAHRVGFLDYPGKIKLHPGPTPYLGGLAIFTAFWAVFGACLLILNSEGYSGTFLSFFSTATLTEYARFKDQMLPMFAGGVMILVLGLIDDRFALKPSVKFAGQILVAAYLVQSGFIAEFMLDLGPFGRVITVFWIVLLLNAFNFIDSINGHCAGIVFIACGAFFLISQAMYQPILGIMMVILGGAILGFLPYNFNKAKAFLGDNGSLFLGYMMAVASLQATYRILQPVSLTPFVPLFIFGVPIYDFVSVVCVRLYRGLPPWRGDRNHFAHRLIRMGLDGNDAVFFSYMVGITTGLIGVLSTQIASLKGNAIIVAIYCMLLMIIAILEYHSARHSGEMSASGSHKIGGQI